MDKQRDSWELQRSTGIKLYVTENDDNSPTNIKEFLNLRDKYLHFKIAWDNLLSVFK